MCGSLGSRPTQTSAFSSGKHREGPKLAEGVTSEGNMDIFFFSQKPCTDLCPTVSFRDNFPPPGSRGRVTHGR